MRARGASLVFTIGLNGYARAYRSCISSQREYALRHGFRYVAVSRPSLVRERPLTAWLKISLLADALRAGYDAVAFIDADARMSADAPDFRTTLSSPDSEAGVDIRAALGRTGRYNSGVIFASRSAAAIDFFDRLIASATTAISEEDRAGLKYENGNFIALARGRSEVGEMSLRWNNTFDPRLDDYVRHFTGPLRDEHALTVLDRATFKVYQKLTHRPGGAPEARDPFFLDRLSALSRSVHMAYPALTRP